jgi:beta-1,4-mannosyl-glycoprotein beta-1,4-N-acetylglucosaminyltransferase
MQSTNQVTIWDTFLYNGEAKILVERINALKSKCDYFVIVESLYTFSGREKKLDMTTKNLVIGLYGERVKWVTITDQMPHLTAWEYESWQRQQILSGLDGINSGDLLMLSDVDEIPNFDFISTASNLELNRVLIAEMDLRIYDVHFLSDLKWHGTIGVKFQHGWGVNFQELRMRSVRHWLEENQNIYKSGGNHFTTIGASSLFREKIRSFSHTEFNVFPYNTKPFLFMISKLGIQLDGSEVLRLDLAPIESQGIKLCSSEHKLDKFRLALAQVIRPLVRFTFWVRVRAISSPK